MEEVCIDDCKNIGPWQRRVPVLKYNFHQLIQSLKPETLAETIESDPRNKSVMHRGSDSMVSASVSGPMFILD